MQRISAHILPSRKIVAEHHWSIKMVRGAVNKAPLIGVWWVVKILQVIGMCCRNWPIWWRFIAQDAIYQQSCAVRIKKTLSSLGPIPPKADDLGDFKYRLPFWWVLAAHANVEILEWAQKAGVDFSRRRDGVGFIYACLASNNNQALQWGLQHGIAANDIDTRGNSLLAFALRRITPEDDKVVDLLISHGASWYYKGPLGESGEDVLKQSPEWTRWHLLRSLENMEPQMARSSRRM